MVHSEVGCYMEDQTKSVTFLNSRRINCEKNEITVWDSLITFMQTYKTE